MGGFACLGCELWEASLGCDTGEAKNLGIPQILTDIAFESYSFAVLQNHCQFLQIFLSIFGRFANFANFSVSIYFAPFLKTKLPEFFLHFFRIAFTTGRSPIGWSRALAQPWQAILRDSPTSGRCFFLV